uniref:MHC class I-like antigen recognition-like domain-containing protein n=1 Tax=Suricata suricatta TaxID=37032 RepID=A0A673U067_SURSU
MTGRSQSPREGLTHRGSESLSRCPGLRVEHIYFQDPKSFRAILTTSFYNRSRTQNQGSAWLGELQTHGWDSKTGAFIYLRPWSRGNFSNEQLMEQEKSFYIFSTRFPLIFQDHVSQWQLECEFRSLRADSLPPHSVSDP